MLVLGSSCGAAFCSKNASFGGSHPRYGRAVGEVATYCCVRIEVLIDNEVQPCVVLPKMVGEH